jgi:hypothetical protein
MNYQILIDPVDGLPNVPAMVRAGWPVTDAIHSWAVANLARHHQFMQSHPSFQEQLQSVQEPH